MDDLFLPQNNEDPNVETIKMNAGLGIHGVENANMVQQIYPIMDDLVVMPENMPIHQDSPRDDDEVEVEMPKQEDAPTIYGDNLL
jgi:hypothetical protein